MREKNRLHPALTVLTSLAMGFLPLLTLALVGCAPEGPAVDTAQVAQAMASGDVQAGGQLYLSLCASCHGPDGLGASGPGLALVPEMSDAELWDIIVNGVEDMPAYGYLTDQEVADLIAWMRANV